MKEPTGSEAVAVGGFELPPVPENMVVECSRGSADPLDYRLAWGVLGGNGFDLVGGWDRHFCGLTDGQLSAVRIHGYGQQSNNRFLYCCGFDNLDTVSVLEYENLGTTRSRGASVAQCI